MNERLRVKHDLLLKLGFLFGPLLRLLSAPGQYDEQEKAEALARFFAEVSPLQREFQQFTVGQQGHDYALQNIQFYGALDGVRRALQQGEQLSSVVPRQLAIAREAVDAVPVPRTSIIQDAGTPFTTYVRLRQLCEVDAIKSLTWLDPFLSPSIFHRYLAGVREGATISLVTTEPGVNASKRDRDRWAEFLDVSRLFASERGNTCYRLIVQSTLHDRWIAFDEKRIYALGGSAKDAADKNYFTITSVEASEANVNIIQHLLAYGHELFGPGTPSHS